MKNLLLDCQKNYAQQRSILAPFFVAAFARLCSGNDPETIVLV